MLRGRDRDKWCLRIGILFVPVWKCSGKDRTGRSLGRDLLHFGMDVGLTRGVKVTFYASGDSVGLVLGSLDGLLLLRDGLRLDVGTWTGAGTGLSTGLAVGAIGDDVGSKLGEDVSSTVGLIVRAMGDGVGARVRDTAGAAFGCLEMESGAWEGSEVAEEDGDFVPLADVTVVAMGKDPTLHVLSVLDCYI